MKIKLHPMSEEPEKSNDVMDYNPNFVNSGNRAKKVIELTFAEWEYRLTVTVEIGGNVRGLSSIRFVLEDYFNSLNPLKTDYGDYYAEIILLGSKDTLSCDVNFEDLENMLIKAEIVSYELITEAVQPTQNGTTTPEGAENERT